jgi:DegV family protein with EDD domain
MKVRIVTDSTCDLPGDLISKYQISVVPMYINLGVKSYRDGIDMTRQEFYERLPNFDPHPTTAAPSPTTFRIIYENLAESGAQEILTNHISSSLSAVLNIARTAAKEMDQIEVTAFDSQQLSLGAGYIVLEAAKAALSGKTVPEILQLLGI